MEEVCLGKASAWKGKWSGESERDEKVKKRGGSWGMGNKMPIQSWIKIGWGEVKFGC